MEGKAEGKEVERRASLKQTGEGVGVWRGVGLEHGGEGGENFMVRALGREAVDDGVKGSCCRCCCRFCRLRWW